jgi:hypothetical protein
MRISTLLLFLSGLLIAGVASGHGQSSADSLPSESSHATWVLPSTKIDFANADDVEINRYPLRKRWDESLGRFTMDNIQPPQDQVCYTMRSYKVERTERSSDSTEPMQYSTCQPSSGFDVKNADIHVIGPGGPQG